jgi:predicted transcriptional regulator
LVKDAALRLLQDDARFREGVERGIAAAERGDFVEHADVWANVGKILQS